MVVVGNGTEISSNISKVRAKYGLTQAQFIEKVKEISGNECDMKSLCTLSAIENGRRVPTLKDMISICKAFNVSLEQLCGLEYISDVVPLSEAPVNDIPENDPKILNYGALLAKNVLPNYDGLPVYVISKNNTFKEGWGILNYDQKLIIFKDFTFPINGVDIDIYTYPPKERNLASGKAHKPLSLNGLKGVDHVWIEMLCMDLYTQGRYNGWYRHNEFNECLINEGNGLTLPYSGLGISYNAYRILSDRS